MIKRVRSEASVNCIQYFFQEATKNIIERGLQHEPVYNMDEIDFGQKSRTKRVIAVKGSRNAWEKSVEASFHLIIVSCVDASNHVSTPCVYFLERE